jgi:hypothetical protein
LEVVSNTSPVTVRVVGGDEKGSLKSETVKYVRKSQGTRNRDRLRWQGPAAHTEDRCVGGGTEPAGDYTFFYGKGIENQELVSIFFVHKKTISAVKRVEFSSNRMSFIMLSGHWCDIIVVKVNASTEDKIVDIVTC